MIKQHGNGAKIKGRVVMPERKHQQQRSDFRVALSPCKIHSASLTLFMLRLNLGPGTYKVPRVSYILSPASLT